MSIYACQDQKYMPRPIPCYLMQSSHGNLWPEIESDGHTKMRIILNCEKAKQCMTCGIQNFEP